LSYLKYSNTIKEYVFLVDNENKVILGWSAKCACSHIKKIFWFLQNNNEDNEIHTPNDCVIIPVNIEEYTTIIFVRNPYKRIISGFLDKYKKDGQLRHLWTHDKLTFSTFIDELLKNDYKMVDEHHFTPQTSEHFNKNKIMKSKCLKIYNIENIDYLYIEKLYNKTIPESLLHFRGGHENTKKEANFEGDVYDLDIDVYSNYNVATKQFYNEEIKTKVYEFYKNDFDFLKENGFNYENTSF